MRELDAYIDDVMADIAESRQSRPAPMVSAGAVQVVRGRPEHPRLGKTLYAMLRPVGVRRRIQALFVGVNWLVAALMVPAILTAPAVVGVPQRLEALAALAAVEAWLVAGYALNRLPIWLDIVGFAALIVMVRGFVSADLALGVFYTMLWVRGLAGSWKGTFSGVAAAAAAYVVGTFVDSGSAVSAEVVGQVVGLCGTAALATVMSRMLVRAEHGFLIQRELSQLGARLIAARDVEMLGEAAATAALNVAPRDEPAVALVELGEKKFAVERTRRGRTVTTTEAGDARMAAGGMTANVLVKNEVAGRVTLHIESGSTVDVAQPIAVVASELGFALERVQLMESLRRESQAKSQFLATMSHELRTPLNSVLGFAQLLSNPRFDALTPRQARYVDHIAVSGNHLLSLINDVLDLSKVSAGRIALSLESFEINDVVEEVVAQLRPVAEGKGVELRHEARLTGSVYADRQRTKQIVVNLLSNAIKFTPGGAAVAAGHRRRGDRIEVCIRDRGLGIEEDQLSRIFEPFTQLDAGKTRSGTGTGLGLALSRHLAEAMDGTLTAVSKVGKGSAFMLLLPITPPGTNGAPPPAQRNAAVNIA
jgi:signal transduction histidine kinase